MDFSKIPVLALFVITLVCAVASSNYKAYYVKKTMKNESEQYSFNAGASLVCALVLFLLSGCKIEMSLYSLLLGLAFGIVTMLNAIMNAKAIKIGPLGYTTVIVSLSTAITALSGAIFWHETLNTFKVIGIVLMLACFALAVDTDNKDGKKANWTWFLFCIITLLTCAGIGLLQKVHQTSEYKNELMGFLIVAFVTSSIISLGGYFAFKRQENTIAKEKATKKWVLNFILALLICGVGVAGNNAINLYLSGVIDAAIFFPIANGVPLLCSLLVSFVLFKERLKKKQLWGLLVGIVAIVCLFV